MNKEKITAILKMTCLYYIPGLENQTILKPVLSSDEKYDYVYDWFFQFKQKWSNLKVSNDWSR